jgi:hypothetical protein
MLSGYLGVCFIKGLPHYFILFGFLCENFIDLLIIIKSIKKADKGMTYGTSILAYLVFGPRRVSIEGTARHTKTIA